MRKAFTLMELLIVISIILIITAVTVGCLRGKRYKAGSLVSINGVNGIVTSTEQQRNGFTWEYRVMLYTNPPTTVIVEAEFLKPPIPKPTEPGVRNVPETKDVER